MTAKIVPADATLIPDEAERVFKGVIYDVYHWQQKLFDDSQTTFEMLRRADTVSAVCLVGDKLIVLQDEQPHRGIRTTFPGGRAEPGEDTLAAVQREIHEETGYEFNNWRLLHVFQPHTKIEQFIYLYIAWDGKQAAGPHVDAGERITVELLPLATVKQLVDEGVGYMGESREIFAGINSVETLLTLPEFVGREITR
ncbi:MAG TPA: NUDIX hydrolase [Candidatus Saccharimonadales bacterium]